MKSTLKISALVLAFAGLTYTAKAQTAPTSTTTSNGIRLSVGVETGIPTGKLNDSHGWNLGGSVQADIPVAEQLFVTVNAGYNNLFGKDVAGVSIPNIQLLPVKGGLKFFPVSNFYIQGEAGAGFALNKKDVGFDKSAAFIWAPQVGVQFPVGNKSYLDAGIRYEASTKFNTAFNDSKVNFLGLRLAYAFDTK
ncbi:outer membrane beta-barrel protein [Mucilaginibacter auburnensis]|uniref:Outer membrane protein with beta-barrel domain n=1 Tax=Mucilaginibacter auburnensis TaxID=1457233 RepID=A0A2H9VS00_9SPHI|nr:outer membrane beta-barrel protein [Mucilaginibacter auburnensis]PJJ83588.1 outer membrane protein with beta-barrel domain [Mucilaginibacter auburnensis]